MQFFCDRDIMSRKFRLIIGHRKYYLITDGNVYMLCEHVHVNKKARL